MGLERARSGERLTPSPYAVSAISRPRRLGAFYNCVSAALPGVPRRVPRRRLPVPGGVGGPPGGRRLLPGDVPVRDARLPAPAAQLEPARVGAHDRAPQGARLPPRERAAAVPRGRRARHAPTEDAADHDAALWARCGSCPASSAPRSSLRFASDLSHDEIGQVLGCSEDGGAAQRPRRTGEAEVDMESMKKLEKALVARAARGRRRRRPGEAAGRLAEQAAQRGAAGRRLHDARLAGRARAGRGHAARPRADLVLQPLRPRRRCCWSCASASRRG